MLEHFAHALVCFGRALQVPLGADNLLDGITLSLGDRFLRCFGELLNSLLVMTKILLASNQDDGQSVAEMKNLGYPLLLDVLEGIRGVNGEANQDDMRVRIRERAEPIVIFLASRIPQCELDVLIVDLHIGNIVLEDGRNINLRESSLGEDYEQTSLPASTIANDDQLASDLSHFNGLNYLAIRRSSTERQKRQVSGRVVAGWWWKQRRGI